MPHHESQLASRHARVRTSALVMRAKSALRRRRHPLLVRFLLWIVLPFGIAGAAIVVYVRSSLPVLEGSVHVAGLQAPVQIVRDDRGVPHVFAETDDDAFFAMGYVHAQDRLWQMDYQRRLGQGRLSEWVGESAVQQDKYMRTLGLARAAEDAWASLDTAARRALVAYSAGVNAWIAEGHLLPLEYLLLNARPDVWKPEHSLLQIKLLALQLGTNYQGELIFDMLVRELGAPKAAELAGYDELDDAAVVELAPPMTDGLLELLARAREIAGPETSGAGSNAWVVGPRLTASGMPVLASDPHLAMPIPAFWYLAEVQGDRLHVAGATIPGLPYVIIGHNESIAWGVVALPADVQDLYVERISPSNEDLYQFEGEWLPMNVREEKIQVATKFPAFLHREVEPINWLARSTRHGPLISDFMMRSESPISLQWTALRDTDRSFESFLGINYAQDWNSFRSALRHHVAPTLTFVYADVRGHVGFSAAGDIPARRRGSGIRPLAGWLAEDEWSGVLPVDALPSAVDPPEGLFVTANDELPWRNFPFHVSSDWASPYRAQRITDLLKSAAEAGGRHSPEDSVQIQRDTMSLPAREMLPLLAAIRPNNEREREALQLLQEWDGDMRSESGAAALFRVWLKYFNEYVLEDDLRGSELHAYRRAALRALRDAPRMQFLVEAATGKRSEWCGASPEAPPDACEVVARAAFESAFDELQRTLGSSPNRWRWSAIHHARYQHALGGSGILGTLLDRRIGAAGAEETVNVASAAFVRGRGYEQAFGPGYRQVIDLGDWNRSLYSLSTGESGNAASEHYDDLIVSHQKGESFHVTFGRDYASGRVLTLQQQQPP